MQLRSILKVLGGGPFWLPRSGTVNDFGVDGGDGKLITCLEDGSNSLTSGFVINPNACTLFSKALLVAFFTFPCYDEGITRIKQPFPLHHKKMTLLQIHQRILFFHVQLVGTRITLGKHPITCCLFGFKNIPTLSSRRNYCMVLHHLMILINLYETRSWILLISFCKLKNSTMCHVEISWNINMQFGTM